MNNNECNSIYQDALNTIRKAEKCKPKCVAFIGPTGPTGPTGPSGEDGDTPSFAIGSVTTGAPGTDASVTITQV